MCRLLQCLYTNTLSLHYNCRRVGVNLYGTPGYHRWKGAGCCQEWKWYTYNYISFMEEPKYMSVFASVVALLSGRDTKKRAKEVSAMLSFEHSNVMSLIGVCIEGEMPLLIMPFMPNGSLLEFLRHHQQELLFNSATEPQVVAVPP